MLNSSGQNYIYSPIHANQILIMKRSIKYGKAAFIKNSNKMNGIITINLIMNGNRLELDLVILDFKFKINYGRLALLQCEINVMIKITYDGTSSSKLSGPVSFTPINSSI